MGIGGCHPKVTVARAEKTPIATAMASLTLVGLETSETGELLCTNKGAPEETDVVSSCFINIQREAAGEFWAGEELGVQPPRICDICRGCPACSEEGLN